MSEKAANWLRGQWYRGVTPDVYRVERGYLRPRPDARWEPYDPCEERPGLPLYERLVRVDLDSEAAICTLANTWGLLGLFSHRLLQVTYDLSWPGGQVECHPMALCYTREGSTTVVASERQQSTAIVETDSGLYRQVPAGEYLDRYYRDKPFAEGGEATGHGRSFRSPFDQEMFDGLCESVDEVRAALLNLQQAAFVAAKDPSGLQIERLSSERESTPILGFAGEQELVHYGGPSQADRLMRDVRRHTRHVQEVPELVSVAGAARWERRWVFPSLLSAAYILLREDILRQRLARCAECSRPFTVGTGGGEEGRQRAKRSDSKYCTPKCSTKVKERNRKPR